MRDGHWGTSNIFKADLANGDYIVNATFGDSSYARNHMAVRAEGAASLQLSGIATAAGQFVHASFPVTVSDEQLTLQVYTDNGTYFVINALEVWPVDQIGTHSLTVNGTTVSGSGATSNAMITVGTDLGSVTAATPDASSAYAGYQVVADGSGNFSFTLVPPGGGVMNLHSEEVTGQRSGSVAATIAAPDYRRFDFEAGGVDVTQIDLGFVGVRGTQLYDANAGYGWQSNVYELDRGTANKSSVKLYRDGHWGSGLTPKTFDVAVDPNLNYDVRFYVGDASYARNQVQVMAEGGTWQTAASTAANNFTTVVISNIDPTDGLLSLSVRDGGGDPCWVINGLDIWVHGTTDPGEAALLPSEIHVQAAGDAAPMPSPPLAPEVLSSMVSTAREYWAATGLTAGQRADLYNTPVAITDLSSRGELGIATPEGIWIDDDGAGRGWAVGSGQL